MRNGVQQDYVAQGKREVSSCNMGSGWNELVTQELSGKLNAKII